MIDGKKLSDLKTLMDKFQKTKGDTTAGLYYDLSKKIEGLKMDKFKAVKDKEAFLELIVELTQKLAELKEGLPKKGVDYFTEDDIDDIVNEVSSIVQSKVKDGKDGKKGERGDKGDSPIVGKDYPSNKQIRELIELAISRLPAPPAGPQGLTGASGKDGKDGSPDSGEEILAKVKELEEGSRWDIVDVNGLKKELSKTRGGGGLQRGVADDLYLSKTDAATTYLKLDCSNDPLTASLGIKGDLGIYTPAGYLATDVAFTYNLIDYHIQAIVGYYSSWWYQAVSNLAWGGYYDPGTGSTYVVDDIVDGSENIGISLLTFYTDPGVGFTPVYIGVFVLNSQHTNYINWLTGAFGATGPTTWEETYYNASILTNNGAGNNFTYVADALLTPINGPLTLTNPNTSTLNVDQSTGDITGIGDINLTGTGASSVGGTFGATGAITAPNFVSNVATGTAPYACTSTTVNTNLNADLWDGYQFSDYLDQAVKQASSPTFAGLTLSTTGKLYFNDNSQYIYSSADNILNFTSPEIRYGAGAAAGYLGGQLCIGYASLSEQVGKLNIQDYGTVPGNDTAPITATTISFTTAGNDAIVKSDGGFTAAGLKPGCQVTVTGSVSNNTTYTIRTITDTTLTLWYGSVVEEAAGASVTLTFKQYYTHNMVNLEWTSYYWTGDSTYNRQGGALQARFYHTTPYKIDYPYASNYALSINSTRNWETDGTPTVRVRAAGLQLQVYCYSDYAGSLYAFYQEQGDLGAITRNAKIGSFFGGSFGRMQIHGTASYTAEIAIAYGLEIWQCAIQDYGKLTSSYRGISINFPSMASGVLADLPTTYGIVFNSNANSSVTYKMKDLLLISANDFDDHTGGTTYGLYLNDWDNNTYLYGAYINDLDSTTQAYGVYVNDISVGGSITDANAWGIYTTNCKNSLSTTLLTDKLYFTQTDANEYIDSLADGYVDIGATTALRLKPVTIAEDAIYFTQTDGAEKIDSAGDGYLDLYAGTNVRTNAFIRHSSANYRRYYHLNMAGIAPGASGATWTEATANNLAGWQLNAAGELLNFDSDVHADWDGASDFTVEIYFQLLDAGSAGNTVDLKLVVYYMASGDSVVKTQTLADVVTTTDGTQYKMYKATFTVPWDAAADIEVGDRLSFVLNLETDTSEIDNILVVSGSIVYNTTHVGIESGDT